MAVPGKHRHTEQISWTPVVAHAVDDAMPPALEKIDYRFDRVAMAKGFPLLAFFGMRRNHVIP
jgi:hypothetical protein